jgi:hypothetical protein
MPVFPGSGAGDWLRNPVTLAKPGFCHVLHPTENRYIPVAEGYTPH